MALTYATTDDLIGPGWVDGDTPTNVDALLAAASRMVRAATKTAVYDTTPTGAPSDPDLAEAFRDAVCAQVAAWVATGVNPTAGPGAVGSSTIAASSIGSGSVTRAARAGQDEARADSLTALVPEAAAILADITALANAQPTGWW